MLFFGALAIGMITGLQNVTTEVPTTDSDVVSTTEDMGLLEPTKLSPPVSDLVNVTIHDRPAMWDVYLHHCPKWRPINHIFFQVANICFLLSFLAPHTATGLIWLRVALILGCAFSGMWAWSVECYLDAVLWNSAFIVINFVYFAVQFYLMRPIKFHKDIEEVYVALFKPLRVSRRQFRRVLMCMRNVRHLKCHELYAHEKVTKVDSLSLVLSGKLVVSQNQRALHIVFPHHFLDSPEWFGVSTDEYFQVSIMAMEESRVLVWHRDKLKLSIMSDGFLQAVFDHILGRDVVHKLMQVSETMAVSNGHLPNSYEEGEDKPMLVVKKAGDGPGITALLNRQLQDTLCEESCITSLRLKCLRDVINHLLAINSTHLPKVSNIVLTSKSSNQKNYEGRVVLCGTVLNANTSVKENSLNGEDFIRLRQNELTLLAQHKYGVRVATDSKWKEFISHLGESAVTFELLQTKPSCAVKINFDVSSGSSRGAAFVLYNCARLETIIRTYNEKVNEGTYPPLPEFEKTDFTLLTQEEEWCLIFNYILGLPSLLRNCVEINEHTCDFRPHLICGFLSSMVRFISQYYRKTRILTEPRKHLLPVMFARLHMLILI